MEKQNLYQTAMAYMKSKREGLENEIALMIPGSRRMKVFAKYVEAQLPKKVLNRCEVSFSQYGRWMECDISPKFGEAFTQHDTMLITSWGAGNEKWEFEKEVGSNGNWRHRVSRDYGGRWAHKNNYEGGSYEITFRATADIDGCRMVKVVETREVVTYKLDCD